MSDGLYSDLGWLPDPPHDFAQQCRNLNGSGETLGDRLRNLSSYRLSGEQLHRIAKAIATARREGQSLAPLEPFRLGILSNSTLDFIVPALTATAARYGFALECITADYNQVVQAALDPNSSVNRFSPDAVLIAVDFRGLPLDSCPGDSTAAAETLAAGLDQLRTIQSGITRNSKAICIWQTLAPPAESLFGSLDRALPGTTASLIDSMNRGIVEIASSPRGVVVDVARLAEIVGLEAWHSPMQWNAAKLPFNNSLLPLYADHVLRSIAALRGKSRRCLILDLDNTLWGGVIGDDGLDGIQIAQGDGTGEAHLSLQRFCLQLRDRGIVLAVCSKNEDETARKPFREHPEMILREHHFAVFQANWKDKASNIQAIAEELSLGLDAMVFLDDNPAERSLVRRLLPRVAVPELPADPSLFARTLSAAGYFESVVFSREDLERASFYQENARRLTLQKNAGDLDSYLKSLQMEITFQPFDETGRARIAQLINKSNQFNLTTRRYTEAEVEAIERDPECFTLQVRLLDVFGDNGMISVVICRQTDPSMWEIDTWLMSCRVLGRQVEQAVLGEILRHAKPRGIHKLIGTYRPTERNRLVEHHYLKLGFAPVLTRTDGSSTWELDVNRASIESIPMLVHSSGAEMAQA